MSRICAAHVNWAIAWWSRSIPTPVCARSAKAQTGRSMTKQSRKLVLEALRSVDVAVIFSSETPLELIMQIRPDVLVKGGDYDPKVQDREAKNYIVGSCEVAGYGGKSRGDSFCQGPLHNADVAKKPFQGLKRLFAYASMKR